MPRVSYTRVNGSPTPPPPSATGAVLFWGNDNLVKTAVTRWLTPGFSDSIAIVGPDKSLRAPRAGTLRNLHVIHNTPTGNGGTITYTLFVNGAASALTIGLASTGVTAADTVNSVVVAKGDILDLRVTKAAGIGNGNVGAEVTVEFA